MPDVEDGAAVINLLRRFHYGEPAAAESTAVPAGAILPALLNPYRDSSAIRYQYPLYLVPHGDDAETVLARPLSEHLAASIERALSKPRSSGTTCRGWNATFGRG
jgi:hypothetical protein